jgi:hypothetical protein
VPRQRPARPDAHWRAALLRLEFPDVASYLQESRIRQHRTVNAMAAEIGVTHHAIESALRRHGLDRIAHAATRHAADERAAQVAAGLGVDSLCEYLRQRRAAGRTWRAWPPSPASLSHGCDARPPEAQPAEPGPTEPGPTEPGPTEPGPTRPPAAPPGTGSHHQHHGSHRSWAQRPHITYVVRQERRFVRVRMH